MTIVHNEVSVGGDTCVVLTTGLRRVHPVDGLLLRAEHLEVMQDYSRDLAVTSSAAGGSGVVWGLTVSIQKAVLTVEAGAALTPTGKLLMLNHNREVKLSELGDLGELAKRPWVIVLGSSTQTRGEVGIFRRLCDDPCGDGTAVQEFVSDDPCLRLVDAELELEPGATLRSILASKWFRREQEAGDPLVGTSVFYGRTTAELIDPRWGRGTDEYEVNGSRVSKHHVALGLLFASTDGSGTGSSRSWHVDVWTARRDRVDALPRQQWWRRLGMRPWNVFVAQVLQFQAHLVTLPSGWDQKESALLAAGISELPPAGYLPSPEQPNRQLFDRVRLLFPVGWPLRFCHCRPDEVSRAIESAQHLDRIPLLADPSEVDILVPSLSPEKPDGSSPLGWVVFLRRSERFCVEDPAVEVETVEVRERDGVKDEIARIEEILASGLTVDDNEPIGAVVGTVDFQVGTDVLQSAVPDAVLDAVRRQPQSVWSMTSGSSPEGLTLARGRAKTIGKAADVALDATGVTASGIDQSQIYLLFVNDVRLPDPGPNIEVPVEGPVDPDPPLLPETPQ